MTLSFRLETFNVLTLGGKDLELFEHETGAFCWRTTEQLWMIPAQRYR